MFTARRRGAQDLNQDPIRTSVRHQPWSPGMLLAPPRCACPSFRRSRSAQQLKAQVAVLGQRHDRLPKLVAGSIMHVSAEKNEGVS